MAGTVAARGPISTRFLPSFKHIGRPRDRRATAWFWLLLALALLAATLGLSVGNRSEPRHWARIWGGPTEGPTPLSLRIELVESDPIRAKSVNLNARLLVTDDLGARTEQPLTFDAEGAAFIRVPRRGARAFVTVQSGNERLASGPIQLTQQSFWQQRKVRGGWWRGRTEGSLVIAVGCREGVLALGQEGHLGIVVTNAAGQPAMAELMLEFEGLETASHATKATLRSNDHGQATLAVVPKDLSASVHVLSGSGQVPSARYFSSIPVERSTVKAGLRAGKVFADSLIPLQRAYFSLVNAQGRWAAGAIDLVCDSERHCRGEAPIEDQPSSPAWLMLGSEPALDGPNVVGWPIVTSTTDFVSESVTVTDRLLLDGKAAVMAEAARRNATRFARVVVGMSLAGLLLSLAIALPVIRSRRESQALASQLSEAESAALTERLPIGALVLLLLVILGLAALVFWSKTRIFGG